MGGIVIALIAAIRVAVGAFDLDDVGPQVGEHHAGAGSRDERALLHDSNSVQYSTHLKRALGTIHGPARNPAGIPRRSEWQRSRREIRRIRWGAAAPPAGAR